MSVANHLGIDLAEYDVRIRTFIPYYEEMLDTAASVVDPLSTMILDLGIGTGALSACCVRRAPHTRILGIDNDSEVLKAAARRLPQTASFLCSTFEAAEFPSCDAVVASFALHHMRDRRDKGKLYGRIASALRDGGQVVVVDRNPASDPELARDQREQWKAHLMRTYSATEAENYLEAWAHEDTYIPLADELKLMETAGLSTEVLWRRDGFAVLRGKRT